jgi:hypothetical protein
VILDLGVVALRWRKALVTVFTAWQNGHWGSFPSGWVEDNVG